MREADARSACSKLRGTPTPFQCAIVPAGDISAANFRSEKFGTVSFYKQLSGKLSDLPVTATYDVWERYASPLEAAWRCRLLAHHVIRCAAIFRTLSDNNGQRSARRLNRYAAIDPKRTLRRMKLATVLKLAVRRHDPVDRAGPLDPREARR